MRAIVTARGLHLVGSNHNERQKWTQLNRAQQLCNEATMALLEETGLQPVPMGLQELVTLAQAPSLWDYRIMVADANRQYACFAFGQGVTLLAFLHEDEHCDTLTSLPGFFGQTYFCGRCLKLYNQQGRHQCSEGKSVHCPGCQQNECDDYIETYLRKRPAHIPCRHCRRQFYGDACFQLHQTKTLSGKACGPNQSLVCDSWHKCASCRKLLRSMNEQDEHRCRYSECLSCHETTDLNQHQCFVQIPTDQEELEDRARIIQINKRTRLGREARNDPNTATEGGEVEEDNTYKPPLLVFWDTEAMQDTGVHVPNLVVGMTEEDALPQIFRRENCMEQFLQWLEQLTEQDTRYVTALAHNFMGYDSYFVVKRLQKKVETRMAEFVKTFPVIKPMNPCDVFFGGRTNASYLYYKVRVGEEIRYVDYTSLYSWVNKNGMYPIGHPEFIYEPGTTDLSEYFALALCTIIPPKNLFHPVLPYRCGGKLTFPLCRTCVEQHVAKPLHEKSLSCDHTEDKGAVIGTWCTPELEKAVAMGYVIQHVHEVCHFEETRRGLFAEYVNTWLKIKLEASGWP